MTVGKPFGWKVKGMCLIGEENAENNINLGTFLCFHLVRKLKVLLPN
jgi:hypothetical protein